MTMPNTRSGGAQGANLGDEAAGQVTATADDAPGGGSDTQSQVRQVRDQVVDRAKDTFREARDRATSSLSDSRRQAADQIGGIASAFHRTGEQLRNENQERVAGLADSLAEQVDRVARYLREADGRAIARDVENLARRQPAAVFGAAFALGLVAARFLKSSDPTGRSYRSDDLGYDRIQPGGQPAGLGAEYGRGTAGGFDASA